MTSPLLALFARSLREDTRLKLTYFARCGLIVVILLFMFTIESEMGWGNGPGLRFFATVMWVDLVFIVLAGCGYFASAITEEKEEATLGLLRMTNLNPLSILLGKSTSRLCGALLLLAAQLPFTMLAVTLGGISLGQILAAYCTLGAFLIFLANLALLGSVVCKRSPGAAVFTVVALVLFFAGVPLLNLIAHLPARLGIIDEDAAWVVVLDRVAAFARLASPAQRLGDIFATGFSDRAFGWQVGSNLVLGAGCFLLAWLIFDRFCGEQQESAPRRAGGGRRRFLRGLRAGRVWSRALAWKDFYYLTGGKVWVLGKLAIYGLPVLALFCWPERWGGRAETHVIGFIVMWCAWMLVCVELAFVAASIFKSERQAHTLSTLAVLPMSMRRIALHKIIGVLPALLPAAAYFVFGAVCAAEKILSEVLPEVFTSNAKHTGTALMVLSYVFVQGIFFLYLTANLSLRIKRGALPLAIGLNWVVQAFLMFAAAAMIGDEAAFAPLIVLTIFAAVILHKNTFSRLEALAAEE
ncbi:MAG: hypothetical protein K8R23_14870 [Chthoniobacter sp.]|nr:hypothetical protein [Chthoniobacter sp.]